MLACRGVSAASAERPHHALVGVYYAVLVLLTAGLAVGARLIVTGELTESMPRLDGWTLALPIAGWCGTALAVYGLWRWRWWGFLLGVGVAVYELAVELCGGGLGWHLARLPVFAGVLAWLCFALRGRFRG